MRQIKELIKRGGEKHQPCSGQVAVNKKPGRFVLESSNAESEKMTKEDRLVSPAGKKWTEEWTERPES